jgi:hypothetical protein
MSVINERLYIYLQCWNWRKLHLTANMRIPVIANSDSEGSRTAVRKMANRCPGDGEESERSDAVFKNISNNFQLVNLDCFFLIDSPVSTSL